MGSANTIPCLESNSYLQNHWLGGPPPEYTVYDKNQASVAKVILKWVNNKEPKNYKNIGVILNKAIHQKFREECQARIIIEAVRNTHPYHYKMGFRVADTEKNCLYASYLKKDRKEDQIPEKDLGSVYMHLPDEARQLWLKEISEHPIGFPTNL